MLSSRIRRRKIWGATIATIAATVLGIAASPASAWYAGNSWIVVGNANCVGGGSVTGVWGAVDGMWSGGDAGDNVLYVRSRIGANNVFNGRAYCNRAWWDPRGDYWINVAWKQFRPRANRQTFWF
jgi:hypothetical protein